jgi:hypothetical protein
MPEYFDIIGAYYNGYIGASIVAYYNCYTGVSIKAYYNG